MIKNAQVGVRSSVRPFGGEPRCGAIGVHSGNHPSQRGRTSIMTAIRGERERVKDGGEEGSENKLQEDEICGEKDDAFSSYCVRGPSERLCEKLL